MKKLLVVLLATAALLALGVSQAVARSGAAHVRTVTVVMNDPGCHWFSVGGKLEKTLTVDGPVSLLDVDESTLKVHTAGLANSFYANLLENVGQRLTLTRGVYTINMIGQKPSDNTLTLTVR